jgi:hypothetical protein
MSVDEIKLAAQMYAIVAEMEEIKANIEAMKADNAERESRGESVAWPGRMFQEASDSLSHISWRFRNEI